MAYAHEEIIPAKFLGYKVRTQMKDADGNDLATPRKYYRVKAYSKDKKLIGEVKSDTNISGKAGTVMFVKAGKDRPNGDGKVEKDAFVLDSVIDSVNDASTADAILDSIEV